MPETIPGVIVHHADRLHVGIDDRRTHEAETAIRERRDSVAGRTWYFVGS